MLQEIDIYQDYISQDNGEKVARKSRACKKRQKIEKLFNHYKDPQFKKVEKQKHKKKQQEKLAKETAGMTPQQIIQHFKKKNELKKKVKLKLIHAKTNGLPILIDLVYQEHMNAKQKKSLNVQMSLISKAMRKLQYPCSLHLCSVGDNVFQSLTKMKYQYWQINVHKQNVLQVGQSLNKQIIYLSPDAKQQLQQVCQNQVYVIGGLVDRSILKNASLNRSKQLNIKARKLPIDKLMLNRKCLNLDHVAMILCKYLETKDWLSAFEYGAPKRYRKQQNQIQLKQEQQFSQDSDQEQTHKD